MKQLYCTELKTQKEHNKTFNYSTWEALIPIFDRNIVEIPNIYYQKLQALYPEAQIHHAQQWYGLFVKNTQDVLSTTTAFLAHTSQSALDWLYKKPS